MSKQYTPSEVTAAVYNDQQINGQDPILYALDHNYPVLDYAHPIVLASLQDRKIEGKDPFVWAIDKNMLIPDHKSGEPVHPIESAIISHRKIEEQDPVEWAVKHGHTIKGMNPIVWSFSTEDLINGEPPIKWVLSHMNDLGWQTCNSIITALGQQGTIQQGLQAVYPEYTAEEYFKASSEIATALLGTTDCSDA